MVSTKLKTKVRCRCKIDGHELKTTINDLQQGHGCKKCRQSIGEKTILAFLKIYAEHVKVHHDIKLTYCQEYYLPEVDGELVRKTERKKYVFFVLLASPSWATPQKFLIEYDGLQHFQPIERFEGESGLQRTQNSDNLKTQNAYKHGYRLIRIDCNQKGSDVGKHIEYAMRTWAMYSYITHSIEPTTFQ